mgnify:FL=1
MQVEDIPHFDMNNDVFNAQFKLQSSLEKCRGIDKKMMLRLAKTSMIRSVNSSLAIEGNEMRPYEVMDVLNGRTVIAPFDEIVETRNALAAYRSIDEFKTWSVDDFLKAQDIMMFGLVEEPGFRKHSVGIFEGQKLIYKAPDHGAVEEMINKLFDWGSNADIPATVLGAAVHFYIESIHPFPDGNGRMGRLWNSKILHDSDPIFDTISMESGIRERREGYYNVLERCQSQDPQDCTEFIVFCLDSLADQFDNLSHVTGKPMMRLIEAMEDRPMTSNEIMNRMKLSNKPHFMKAYIEPALKYGLIARTEDCARSRNQMYRKLVDRWAHRFTTWIGLLSAPMFLTAPLLRRTASALDAIE